MFCKGQTFRLYERGEAGICCDVDGVALGPVKLVERVEKSYFVLPVEEITLALEVAYGALPKAAAEDLALKIVGIARSLNARELVLAKFKALYLRLPEIPCERLAKMNGVWLEKYNQCHDSENGRFCETGGGVGEDIGAGENSNEKNNCKPKTTPAAHEAAANHKVGIKEGVKVENLAPKMVDTISVVSSVAYDLKLPNAVITSGNDGKHMPGSLHYSNNALDFRGNNITIEQGGEFKDHIQDRLGVDYQMFFETFPNNPGNNHIHIEYQPKAKSEK